jgi:Phospholipid-translocating P-type ATPase C-terminal
MELPQEFTKYNIKDGRKNLTFWLFSKNIFLAIWHAFVIFAVSLFGSQAYGSFASNGLELGL